MKIKGTSHWHPAYSINCVICEFILVKKGSLTAVLIFVKYSLGEFCMLPAKFSPLSPTVSASSLSLYLSRAGGARKIDSI